jgi:D-arabinose 1-dehydrogenase-like Zn-dependent alcohol dehydrogenase
VEAAKTAMHGAQQRLSRRTMRAAWLEQWGGELHHGERTRPSPGDGEVLVEVEACGIGLTVLNCIRGDLGDGSDNLPRIPGHELVGRIAELGSGVHPSRLGERVMAYFYLFCGRCRMCLAGAEPMCQNLAGYLGVHRDGGYAACAVLPARNAIPLPEAIQPSDAAAIPDAIATPVHVAARAGIAPSDRVAVVAAGGGVGIHMVQVARLHGADVVGLDAVESKLAFLSDELGVGVVDSSDFASARLPARWHGQADMVVDLLGTRPSLEWSLDALASNGRLVVLTTFRDIDMTVRPRDLVLTQASVMGSRYAARHELLLAARLVASGQVQPVIGLRVRIDDVESAHRDLRAGRLLGRGALIWDKEG